MYFQGISQLKELPQSEVQSESALFKSYARKYHIKSTARECNNHKDSQEMPQTKVDQSKVYTGSVAIKSTDREFTMKITARECHIGSTVSDCHTKKYCQGVLQSNIHPGNAKIKCSARECHKSEGLQGSNIT